MTPKIIPSAIILFVLSSAILLAQEWRNEVTSTIRSDKSAISQRKIFVKNQIDDKRRKENNNRVITGKYNKQILEARQTDLILKSKEFEQDRIKNKIQTIINNPDIYPSESIEPLQQSNVSIQNEINSLKKSLKKRIIGTKITEGQINILNEEISELEISIFRIRTEIKEIAENIIEIVKVEEKCIITQNISPNDCKVAAIKNSEKRAVELGGQSLKGL